MLLALILLVVAVVAVGAFAAIVMMRARRQALEVDPSIGAPLVAPEPETRLGAIVKDLQPSFRSSLSRLRTLVRGVDFRYGVPWYLLLGPAESGKTTLLAD